MSYTVQKGSSAGAVIDVLWCPNVNIKKRGTGWSFPPPVRRLLKAETEGKTVLHPFGGKSDWGVRMDIDPHTRPDVIADAWLPPFGRDSFDVVILDPPYTHFSAGETWALLRTAAWIARERVVWFHTIWARCFGPLLLEKAYLVRVGDQCSIRVLQFLRSMPHKRAPEPWFKAGPAMKYNRWLSGAQLLPFGEEPRCRSPKP